MAARSVLLVEETPGWAGMACDRLQALATPPRILASNWIEFESPCPPLARVICAELRTLDGVKSRALKRLGDAFALEGTVVCYPAGEARRHVREFAGLGHPGMAVLDSSDRGAWLETVASLLRTPRTLLPLVVRALGVADARVARACRGILSAPEVATTVEGWARALGYSCAQTVEAQFRPHGIPPLRLLGWLRLLSVVDWAAEFVRRPTREEIAGRFRYRSGDSFGRHVKELSGRTAVEALEAGSDAVLQRIRAAALRRWTPSSESDVVFTEFDVSTGRDAH